MNNNNRPTNNYSSARRTSSQNTPQNRNTAAHDTVQRKPTKKKFGIRIGKYILRPRLIAALLVIAVVVGTVIGISSREPECYELSRSSITILEEAEAVLIKDEAGYSYPEGITIVSRVKDGTLVNLGDEIAVIRTAQFNNDWYAQLEIARRNTVNYMLERLTDDDGVLQNALDIIDAQIKSISEEMINTLSFDPARYSEYSQRLRELYIEKRDTILSVFGTDTNINEYLNKESVIQDKINSCTQSIYAMNTGIISYNSDGYANVYNYSNIDTITQTTLNNIINDSYSSAVQASRTACDYYISDMTKCYIIMEGTENTFRYLEPNDEAIIRLNSDNSQFMANVTNAVHNDGSSFITIKPIGTFSEFYRARVMNVSVQKSWSGLVVPKEHIVKKKDQYGVYVYEDGKKTFVPITILAENENVVVLDTSSVDNIFKQGTKIIKQ